jgi:hypothetical protein
MHSGSDPEFEARGCKNNTGSQSTLKLRHPARYGQKTSDVVSITRNKVKRTHNIIPHNAMSFATHQFKAAPLSHPNPSTSPVPPHPPDQSH